MGILSIKIKTNLTKIIIISVTWGMAGLLFTINEYFGILHFAEGLNVDVESQYKFKASIIISSVTAAIGGLILGTIEVFFIRKKIREYSLGKAVLLKTLIYSTALIGLILIGSILYNSVFSGRDIFNPIVYQKVLHHMFSTLFWSQILVWTVVIIITLFFLQINDKFGRGMLLQLLIGKYHQPKIEQRIFMFLDLKSATTIAEKLKHKKYFELLNDFFNDASDPILMNDGEIYQYVGDEITISWKLNKSSNSLNCLKCFYDIQKAVRNSEKKYLFKYGLIPEFKAGIHSGEVSVGEVGELKREVVFSGDVLNTASRIQNECNKYDVDVLISEELKTRVDSKQNHFSFKKISEIQLKGKNEYTTLYAVEQN